MKRAIIWDLDGTLLDSYHVIVESLQLALEAFGSDLPYEAIWQYAIDYSSNALIEKEAAKISVPSEMIFERYSQESGKRFGDIRLVDHAKEILEALKKRDVEHFVYTHRGKTTIPVLRNLELEHYFREILTSKSGCPRKPAPDAIQYLMEKYDLDPKTTYYVGDRSLDMECARNAGIQGILFLPKNSHGSVTGFEDYIVENLMDILSII